MDAEEREAIIRCQKGEVEAFELLVERYHRKLYWVACSMLGDATLAQDIVQETFIRALAALKRFDVQRSFRTWVHQIALNLCIDHLRRQRIAKEVSLDGLSPVLSSPKPSNPEQEAMRGELRVKVRRILEKLPPKYRMVLSLRDIEGMSFEEIAEILNANPTTVRWYLHRARKFFFVEWEKVHEMPQG
jgi:RNA polymerase sigma-70 factor (ECF subfamily)